MKKKLGPLELVVMQVVWERDEVTVRAVWEILYPTRRLAYTTVATVLRQTEAKGYLAHRIEGRSYIYRPLISRDEVSRGMVRDLLEGVFQGSASALVSTLVETKEITREELDAIQKMIEDSPHDE
jgi:BlaI family transcriptional regulator, penicillinase repressor